MSSAGSLCEDFILASGPQAAAWLATKPGLQVRDVGGGTLQVATTAGVRHGRHADGRHWLAIADLISGDLEEAAAGTATAPQRH